MVPFQPIANQTAQVFRIALSGDVEFGDAEMDEIMNVMIELGEEM